MPRAAKPVSGRERVKEHRARLRAQGLRPIQMWVPDVDAPDFIAEAHRESLAIANSLQDAEDQAFIDSVTDWSED